MVSCIVEVVEPYGLRALIELNSNSWHQVLKTIGTAHTFKYFIKDFFALFFFCTMRQVKVVELVIRWAKTTFSIFGEDTVCYQIILTMKKCVIAQLSLLRLTLED
ncbi:hypothetical protein Q672_18980 [Marinobacter sp. EVN1]|nr:hypothetical protein Q672_18980 [Marinobacter sp. EVN1]